MSLIEAVFAAVTDSPSGFHITYFVSEVEECMLDEQVFDELTDPVCCVCLKQCRSSLFRIGASWAWFRVTAVSPQRGSKIDVFIYSFSRTGAPSYSG